MPDEGEINQTEALLREADQSEEKLQANVNATNRARIGRDRSHIVWCVMGVYAFAIVLAVAYLFYRGIICNEPVFSDLSELIKVAILPVVTLVIGYYFGSAKLE